LNSDARIFDYLDDSAARFPFRRALKDKGQWYLYNHLKRCSDATTELLRRTGVHPQERVLLICANSVDYPVLYFGALRAGVIVVPVPTDVSRESLRTIVEHCTPSVILCQQQYADFVSESIRSSVDTRPIVISASPKSDEPDAQEGLEYEYRISGSGNLDLRQRPVDRVSIVADDIALILYTSGSTGKPKGVCLTHRNITSNVDAISEYLEFTGADIMMQVLPFYYSYGKSFLHLVMKCAGAVVINNQFAYCNAILDEMENEYCTGFAGVPSTFYILIRHSNLHQRNLPSLRFVTLAGGAMEVGARKELRDSLPFHADFFVMYGQTEASARLTYLPPEKFSEKPASIGQPLSNVSISVLNQTGLPCRAMEIGEICAKGPNVTQGYWNNEEESLKLLRDGYLHTGDLGYIDEDGYLFITGRIKNMIKSGGYRVSASEVEAVIREHESVCDVHVFGVADNVMGEAIHALVVMVDQTDVDCITTFCANQLPFYKRPKRLIVTEMIPRRPTGKIDQEKVRSLIDA